ncbi:MAG: NADH-quinone oxidoreductase subunit NuoG [Nitrospirae bacterium]|nr:NADH-quinone oxidoreductase subunit NuoG [Nitrospirota bacterium]
MVTLRIDDRETTVADGTMIIEAARGIGIEIPHFCYHPKLSVSGSCKMCLVEVEGLAKLVTACTTAVSRNIVVRTRSEKVKEAQRATLSMLLINHPLDCPVCDKGGECPLQDYTYRYGPGKSEFSDEKWHFKKPVDLSPLIVLDRERCILCTRCVRFQEEVAVHPEIEVTERGRGSFIEVARPEGFTSNFSGNTIELCPVGALTSRPFRFKARPWELKRSPSLCPHCGCGCNIWLDVREDKIMRVLARENPPVDGGWLCDRGRFGYRFVSHASRLKTPLIRKGEGFIPCTWEEAISRVIGGFKKGREVYGSESIRGLASPKLTNEELYLFRKFFQEVAGTNSSGYTLNGDLMIESLRPADCSGLRRFSFQDIDEADSIFLIDGDPSKDLPILDLRIKKAVKKGARLFIAGSAEIELSDFASASPIPVGTELNSVPEKGGKGGFDRRFSGEIRDSKRSVILLGRKTDPSEVESLCSFLKELHDNGGGEGWISLGVLMPAANTQGAQDMLSGDTILNSQGIKYGVPGKSDVPDSRVKCLFIARQEIPDITNLRNHLDFLAVYDIFLSDTARVADVVLPAAAFSEIDGTYTNSERRVQRLFKTTQTPGEAKPLWEVMTLLAKATGTGWDFHSSRDVMREISEKISLYRYISYEEIGMKGSYADGTTSGPRYYR